MKYSLQLLYSNIRETKKRDKSISTPLTLTNSFKNFKSTRKKKTFSSLRRLLFSSLLNTCEAYDKKRKKKILYLEEHDCKE